MALFLLSLPPAASVPATLNDVAPLGFGGVLWRARSSLLAPPTFDGASLVEACRAVGLRVIIEADMASLPIDDPLVQDHPTSFALRRVAAAAGPIDPRRPFASRGVALATYSTDEATAILIPRIVSAVQALASAGVDGVLLAGLDRVPDDRLSDVVAALHRDVPDVMLLADVAHGTSSDRRRALRSAGIDAFVTSGGDTTMPAGGEASADGAPDVVLDHISDHADARHMTRQLFQAAARGDGAVIPIGLVSAAAATQAIVRQALDVAGRAAAFAGELRLLTDAHAPVVAMIRADRPDIRQAGRALLILRNDRDEAVSPPSIASLRQFMGAEFARFEPVGQASSAPDAPLQPAEVRLFEADRAAPVLLDEALDAGAAARADRLVIDDVRPRVDGGDFAVKRVAGEIVPVEATIFADGHEQLAAELMWRAADDADWQRAAMTQLPNDQWRGAFATDRLGRYEFRIEAWLDRFGAYRRDLAKKIDADVAQPVDYAEGRVLVEAAAARSSDQLRGALDDVLAKLGQVGEGERAAALLLAPETVRLMQEADDRPHRIRSAVHRLDAERTAARFSSWYELFPRSQTDSPARHGTFADVVDRLPAIQAMGFDTLYFPPIHPIGRVNRKGRNNSLTPGPDDPGSPYAIGSSDGGHDALHPELGTFDDFARLIAAAQAHGLEIALDFAVQCSPDHPWLQEHPGWFAWRPDGSMKYAENPPKKYQDIVNVDFYADDAVPGLWLALRDVVLLWVSHGVKTFRVDNPHTKPLPFWEWMIGAVRAQHPEVIFLAEAFTRPAMMYRLGKIGFSQSYTYFTWRDGKQELIDYFVELTTTPPQEFYRPHLFVNTPDINPVFLQQSGRPGFLIRAALAATLSGLFGVYSGFELCEAAALPGKEEYLDSEKYEIRPRDWNAPGNIVADITLLNRLRRQFPALQTHLNTRFYVAHNDSIIWYGKPAPDFSHMIMVMVSLDPHRAQEADFEIPLWEFGLGDDATIQVDDLARGDRFQWRGKFQHIRIEPTEPYRIWRIAPGDDQ